MSVLTQKLLNEYVMMNACVLFGHKVVFIECNIKIKFNEKLNTPKYLENFHKDS
jgi:hypothetical protein